MTINLSISFRQGLGGEVLSVQRRRLGGRGRPAGGARLRTGRLRRGGRADQR